MKRILSLLVVFSMMNTFAQQISDYSYIFISDQPKDFAGNKFGLQDLLNSKLKAKNYVPICGESSLWPEPAKSNPCSVLQADLHNSSSFLKNKLRIDFTECNQKIIASLEGKSSIKDYEPGFKDALNVALRNLPASNPEKLAVNNVTPKQNVAIAAEPVKSTLSQTQKSNVKTGSKAQTFSNGTLNLNRIHISENQFILASPNNSMPYAIFKESTKKEVYRVQLQDGTQTLGYLENGNIVIEIAAQDGSYKKEVFEETVILAY
ncbi:hypothetical protein FIC_00430 [Flavobacteriaceae bacterium 3519-10]|nr:hypothetical protein FIC_00430 [Flavobacteriaceae bacterium 3519-10]